MQRIAVIGDIHAAFERLEEVVELLRTGPYTLALLVGDLGVDLPRVPALRLAFRRRQDRSIRRVLETVGNALDCPVVFVPGNHDLPDPPADLPGINCDGTVVTVAGLRVGGLGGAGPTRFGFPHEWSEETAEQRLRSLEPDAPLDILLCHSPPHGTGMDRIHLGTHVGSVAVRRALTTLRPGLFVCGHIHEGWGVERMDGVPCLNAGSLGRPFEQRLAWTVSWSDGAPRKAESIRPPAPRHEGPSVWNLD